ncbi:MAG: hypothetical protein V4625_17425 [Pseudomonadota bacterium]
MPRPSYLSPLTLAVLAGSVLLALQACSPGLNWRDVRPDDTGLVLLLPCKPDKAQKTVPLGGAPTEMTMLGCDAGGATFAIASADIGDAGKAAEVLAQWQKLTLANMKATAGAPVVPLKVVGAAAAPQAVLVKAQGQRADGQPVTGQGAYFARGSKVFQAVMYAAKPSAESSETFFSSLKFE